MRKPYLFRDAQPYGLGRVGCCVHCGAPPTKEALFHADGAILVEKYCDSCLQPKTFELLMWRYAANGS